MSLKDSLNAALFRTTGYGLTRETPEQRREAIAAASRAAAQRARARTAERERRRAAERDERRKEAAEARRIEKRRLAEQRREEMAARREQARREAEQRREEERAALIARGGDLPAYYDDVTRGIIATVRPRTMTSPIKLQALIEAVRYLERREIPGAMIECGVWRGGSVQAVALTLLDLERTERELHLFDTFEGMSEPTALDVRLSDGQPADQLLATNDRDASVWARASLEDVKLGMEETGYPADKVFFHQGKVEETVPGDAPGQIALLRLDTDWYESTRHELEHLYDRLSPGGVVIFDDYDAWAGARKAVDEWMQGPGRDLCLVPIGPGRIAIKPIVP